MPHGGVEHLLMQRKRARENAVHHYANGGGIHAAAQKLQSMGHNGDTILAHINPEEAALLKRMGGSGKINPNTGLMSFDNPSMGAYDGPKTDTSGGPGSAPGGDGSKSGSQGMGAGTGSSGGKTDTSGGPGSAPGGDGSKSGSQGMGAGTGSKPSGGIADLPAKTSVDAGAKDIPQRVKDAFKFGIVPNEAGVDPNTGKPLTSVKGAHGIAQVLESTGPEAAADAGLEWSKEKWLTDTDYNYTIGEAYYNKLVNRYDGDLTKAAGAYNYGFGNFDKYLAGKKGLPDETRKYLNDFTDKISKLGSEPTFNIPDPQAGITGVAPKPVNIKPQDVSTTPAPATETNWWDKTVHDLPGNVGGAIVSAMFPPAAIYGLAATGVNYFTGKETMPTIPGAINRAYYGDGSPTTSTTAPTAEEYDRYGAAGDGSPNSDPLQMYKELYGGGSDKKLLGIESLDRSPLVPGIDPSVPSVPPDATDPSVPLFDYNYSNFGITGVPTAEYKYSNFGL